MPTDRQHHLRYWPVVSRGNLTSAIHNGYKGSWNRSVILIQVLAKARGEEVGIGVVIYTVQIGTALKRTVLMLGGERSFVLNAVEGPRGEGFRYTRRR
jgi:hypothetical protein